MGRPGKYATNVLPRMAEIEAWARDGVPEHAMAKNCGVSYFTWKEYKKQYPAFSTILARGRDYVDNVIVLGAYLKRIEGYDVDEPEEEYTVSYDDDGTQHLVLKKVRHKKRHIPGDPRAAEFWLTRRRGKEWPMNVAVKVASEDNTEGGVILIPAVVEEDGNLDTTT